VWGEVITSKDVGGCPAHFAVADDAITDGSFIGEGAHVWQVEPDA